MRDIFVEFIEHGLEHYEECPLNHEPNEVTRKTLEKAESRKGLKKATTAEELFKELSE